MQINPYLTFNGNCADAFTFYAKALGGTIVTMQTHGDSPMKDHVPANWQDKILHAQLAVGGNVLMGSDAPPDRYAVPQGFSVSVQIASTSEAARVFHALAAHGSVTMAFDKTFWSPGFGMLKDQFGVHWMVNCAQPGA